jgi:hypothetical protein
LNAQASVHWTESFEQLKKPNALDKMLLPASSLKDGSAVEGNFEKDNKDLGVVDGNFAKDKDIRDRIEGNFVKGKLQEVEGNFERDKDIQEAKDLEKQKDLLNINKEILDQEAQERLVAGKDFENLLNGQKMKLKC